MQFIPTIHRSKRPQLESLQVGRTWCGIKELPGCPFRRLEKPKYSKVDLSLFLDGGQSEHVHNVKTVLSKVCTQVEPMCRGVVRVKCKCWAAGNKKVSLLVRRLVLYPLLVLTDLR
jgi:hypothetical protein